MFGHTKTDEVLQISPALAARVFRYAVENPIAREWVPHFGWSDTRLHVGHCFQLLQPESFVPNFVSFPPHASTASDFLAQLALLYRHKSWTYFAANQYLYWLGMFTHPQQDLIVQLLRRDVRVLQEHQQTLDRGNYE